MLENFNFYLMTLNVLDKLKLLLGMITNKFSDNIVNTLPSPLNLELRILSNTNPKNFTILGFIFSLILYKWLVLFKRVLLWPFKLGIFSFIFSIAGFDVTWFLNLFNFLL